MDTNINFVILAMVTGALLLAAVYHSVLYYYNRLKLLGSYTLYLWSVFVYCFTRCIYYSHIPETLFIVPDELLQMVSFVLYIKFTKVAMELDRVNDPLAYWFCKVAPPLVVVYIVAFHLFRALTMAHLIPGVFTVVSYLFIRAILLFVGFTSLIAVIKRRTNVYYRYIFYAIFSFILLGLLATVFEVVFKFKTPISSLSLLALGYNLDVFFFSAAISYRVRQETIEKEAANKRVLEQEIELQKANLERVVYSYKVKEEERNRIATELHDELGSTLSSISILSDVILNERNETSLRAMQEEIQSNTKLMMEKMDDIIWSMNPRNDSMAKMLLRIRLFATPLFEARNINYHFDFDEKIFEFPITIEKRQQGYLILKEAVNNLVKHAKSTEAYLAGYMKDEGLVLQVSDNGRGYETSSESTGNGLYNMKQRAENISAVLQVESGSGKGTVVTLLIK